MSNFSILLYFRIYHSHSSAVWESALYWQQLLVTIDSWRDAVMSYIIRCMYGSFAVSCLLCSILILCVCTLTHSSARMPASSLMKFSVWRMGQQEENWVCYGDGYVSHSLLLYRCHVICGCWPVSTARFRCNGNIRYAHLCLVVLCICFFHCLKERNDFRRCKLVHMTIYMDLW